MGSTLQENNLSRLKTSQSTFLQTILWKEYSQRQRTPSQIGGFQFEFCHTAHLTTQKKPQNAGLQGISIENPSLLPPLPVGNQKSPRHHQKYHLTDH